MNQLTNIGDFHFSLKAGMRGNEYMPNTIEYMFTCGRAIKDQGTGLFTYVDAFGNLFIPRNSDSLIQSFFVVGRLHAATGGNIKVETTYISPDGIRSAPSIVVGEILPGFVDFACYFPIAKFTQIGKHYLKIKLQEEELEAGNKFYFEVRKQE